MTSRQNRAAFAFALLAGACGGAQIPPDATTTVISLQHLDCADCGERLAKDLGGQPGVYKATFDRRRAEVAVVASRGFDAMESAKRVAGKEDYAIVPGSGRGQYIAFTTPPEGADVSIIAKDGADVADLSAHLERGKITVVDFFAPWCEPCRKLDDHVLAIVAERKDVAYRKLDIADWDSPLARHYLKSVRALPYAIVFDKDGNKIDAIDGLDLAKLDAAIARGNK